MEEEGDCSGTKLSSPRASAHLPHPTDFPNSIRISGGIRPHPVLIRIFFRWENRDKENNYCFVLITQVHDRMINVISIEEQECYISLKIILMIGRFPTHLTDFVQCRPLEIFHNLIDGET